MPMQRLNKAVRDGAYQRTLVAARHAISSDLPMHGQCLELAWAGLEVIRGIPDAPRTILQAGTMQWPCITPDLDDGECNTHMSYMWDPDSLIAHLLRRGIVATVDMGNLSVASLPEMHVWLACPETGEIVDFSTGFLPAACEKILGEHWRAPLPPDYLWTFGNRLPDGVRYLACRDAIDVAINVLHKQGRRYP